MPNYIRNPIAWIPFLLFIFMFWITYTAPKDGESHPICGKECTVLVDRVIDGDTFESDGQRYRLANVNAQEAGTAPGDIDTDCLRRRIEGEYVEITTFGHDVYHRVRANVTSHYTTC